MQGNHAPVSLTASIVIDVSKLYRS